MTRAAARRQLTWLGPVLATSLGLLAGCFGVSSNPSSFPYLLPTGDIIRTHAKPPGLGYFANFDPHSVRMEVRPTETTNPVRTQQVLIATIYDAKNQPRRSRRVEWMLEGVGNIVEVDESGYFPGRGYKVDNKYAVSYTDYCEHTITRGTPDPNDDFTIRPGQSWCVISAAVEGDTHVTVYAPEIADWNKHKVYVTTHWVDADWQLPVPMVAKVGTQQPITTSIFRHTDKQPLANYRVRYRLLDGPPAVFLQGRATEAVAISDLSGLATVSLIQQGLQPGVNHVGIEVIRPPDPQVPSGSGIVIARGETSVDWQGPQIGTTIVGPPTAAVRQEITYTINVANTGQVETQGLTVRSVVPEGLRYLRSQPPANVDGNQLVWTLGGLAGAQTSSLQAVFSPERPGAVTFCANAASIEGLKADACATTQITQPQLTVAMTGMPGGVVGMPLNYTITIANPGTGPATNVLLTASFDPGLTHDSRANPVELPVGTLAAGETKSYPLTLTPRQAGQLVTRAIATGDGGLRAESQPYPVIVQTAKIQVDLKGPAERFVERPAEWTITVTNPSDVPLANVVVRNALPPGLSFLTASDGGTLANNIVTWNLGTLAPRQQRGVSLTTRCDVLGRSENVAVALADPNLQAEARAVVTILGLTAFDLQLRKAGDPAEVGGRVTYTITVTNIGSLPAKKLQVSAFVPDKVKLLPAADPTQIQKIEGQRIDYNEVAELPPKQTLSYSVEVQALQAGDVRFRAELKGQDLRSAVIKEESTMIFDPTAPARPGAAPPGAPAAPPAPAAPGPIGETKPPLPGFPTGR